MFSSELLTSGLTAKPTMLLICRQTSVVHYSSSWITGQVGHLQCDTAFLSDDLVKLKGSADRLPVALFDAGVTDGRQDGQVLLELIYLVFEVFRDPTRPGKIRQRLSQFMHGPPHDVQLIGDFLSIQLQERA